MTTRRDFIKKNSGRYSCTFIGKHTSRFGSSRYQDILGANEKIRIGGHWSEFER